MTGSNGIQKAFFRSRITLKDTKTLSQIYEENPEFKEEESPYSGSKFLNDRIHLHSCDITDLEIDAIVCSTQTDLSLDPIGICKRVWNVGGERLRDACKVIQHCIAGTAFLTSGYDLPADYVIHTAGPPPDAEISYSERKQCLKQSYLSCLQIVEQRPEIKSVAFPCIGSGGAGIRMSTAVTIAVETLREWLTKDDNASKIEHIVLCMYDNCQWEDYCQKLRFNFPFPSEIKKEHPITRPRYVSSLDEDSQLSSTNVLCYKYMNKESSIYTYIESNLFNLIETLKQTFSNPTSLVTDSETFTEIDLQKIRLILRMRHSQGTQLIEFQLFNVVQENINTSICSEVAAVIELFLVDHFAQMTDFKTYVRCERSYMGEPRRGLFHMDKLLLKCRDGNMESRCEHPLRKLTHLIIPDELLSFWNSSRFCKIEQRRTPVEHEFRQDGVHQKSLTLSIPYLPPITSPSEILPNIKDNQRELDEMSWTSAEHEVQPKEIVGIADSQCQSLLSKIGCAFKKGFRKTKKKEPGNGSREINSDVHGGSYKDSDETCIKFKCESNLPTIHIQSSEQSSEHRNIEQAPLKPIKGHCANTEFGKFEKSSHINVNSKAELSPICNKVGTNLPPTESVSNQNSSIHNTSFKAKVPTQLFENDITGVNEAGADRETCTTSDSGTSVTTSSPSISMESSESVFHFKPDATSSPDVDVTKIEPKDSVSEYDTDTSFDSSREKGEYFCGNYKSKMDLSDRRLLRIARKFGNKHKELGIELGLADSEIQTCQVNGEGNPNMFGLHILKKWRIMAGQEANLETLYTAMDNCDIDTFYLRNPKPLSKT